MRKVPRTLQLLSRRQVAKLCDCSPASITNAVRAGELRTVAITTSPGHEETRIPLESLLQYFEQQTGKTWSASDLLELRRMPRIAELLSLSVEVSSTARRGTAPLRSSTRPARPTAGASASHCACHGHRGCGEGGAGGEEKAAGARGVIAPVHHERSYESEAGHLMAVAQLVQGVDPAAHRDFEHDGPDRPLPRSDGLASVQA